MDPNNLTPEQMQQIAAMAAAFQQGTKAASSTPTGVYLHGPGGLLSTPGLQRGIVNATISPLRGLRGRLPWRRSLYEQEIKGVLTGVTASTGENPTAPCLPGKQPGNLKLCMRTLPFGTFKMQTQTIDILRIGQLLNQCEMVDPVLMGDPFAQAGPAAASPMTVRDLLKNEISSKLALVHFAMNRDFGPVLFTGDTANTVANAELSYNEYFGLDYQINTGYQDAKAQVPCPAVDSYVVDSGQNVRTNASDVVALIINVLSHLEYLSRQTGLDPVEFALVGRYGLFRALTEVWPCVYMTYLCTATPENALNNVNAAEMVRMRDEMRNGSYLLVDGKKIEFIIDDFAPESYAGAAFSSDLYIVPMTSPAMTETGGAATYWEYIDWNSPMAIGSLMSQLGQIAFKPTLYNNGKTLVFPDAPSGSCYSWEVVERYRLVVEVPFLAARITDLRYTMAIHERSGIPGNDYFYNGGQYMQNYPQYLYPPTNA